MTADERKRAYHGAVLVSPEREQAWSVYKDGYLASCISAWADQGSSRQEMLEAAAAVLHELEWVDGLAWTPLGEALQIQASAALGDRKPVVGEAKVRFINSLRTAQTSTEADRIRCVAYQLGITVTHAITICGKADEASKQVEPEVQQPGRVALYRHFDMDGTLLYVGIAKEPVKRAEQHRYHSKWYRFVANTVVEWHADREEAAEAERQAIRSELPVFNQSHNKLNRDAAIEYLFSALTVPEVSVTSMSKAERA